MEDRGSNLARASGKQTECLPNKHLIYQRKVQGGRQDFLPCISEPLSQLDRCLTPAFCLRCSLD